MLLRQQLPVLQQKIRQGQHRIWKPPEHLHWTAKQPFIQECTNVEPLKEALSVVHKETFPDKVVRCQKIKLHLNALQQDVLKRWCYAYVKMYNAALHCVKRLYHQNKVVLTNFQKLRTCHMKSIRDEIIRTSFVPKYGSHTTVKTHMLDGAIQLVCANYKSALSNYKAGNIQHFRLRYWRKKTLYRLDVEPSYINANGICDKVLGAMKATYDGHLFDWNTVHRTCQVQYDSNDGSFALLVPCDQNAQPPADERKPWIALDPGIRTFLTGLSQSETLKIGDGLSNRLMKYLYRVDHVRNKNKARRLRDKVKHLVDDMHWKAANYLVQNYETIFIGDMSAKRVIRGKGKGLASHAKRTLMALSLFKFHQRLEYKAQQYHAHLQVINEAYTTKVCSCCAVVNEGIGSQRVFACKSCNHRCDRDVDGARCIAIKALI